MLDYLSPQPATGYQLPQIAALIHKYANTQIQNKEVHKWSESYKRDEQT